MVISIVSIVVVLLIGYIWLTRGFFSALIHLLCTIIAGAVAFAAWEPIAIYLLNDAKATGVVAGSAWAIGLAAPFVVTLGILRPVLDRIIRANVQINSTVDFIGGGLLGVASGTISVGILVTSLSFLRVDYLGCQSFTSGGTGNVERSGGLWVPFDKFTFVFYSHLSQRAFKVEEPLAKWQAAAYEVGNANRMSPFEGSGRNTFRPGDIEVKSRFTVGSDRTNFNDLLHDQWDRNPQAVTDPNGEPYPPQTHIEGFVVSFKAGSKEKDGQSAIGNAQAQLVLENASGDQMLVFPFAVSSQASPQNPGVARWKYNAADVFIASVGGASETPFAFEFPCPPGYQPIALYVKGLRHRIDQGATSQPRAKFNSAEERDAGLTALGLGGQLASTGTSATPGTTIDASGVIQIGDGRPYVSGRLPEGIQATLRLPWNVTLQKGQHGQLDLSEENNTNIIMQGTAEIYVSELPKALTERGLRVENFIADSTTVLIQMEVGPSSRTSLLGGAVTAAENILPPMLVDTQGDQYQPVGFVYQDETVFKVRFSPGDPIRSMSQLPSLSRSRPTQKMVLLFRVSLGREIKMFNKGSKTIYDFNPPFKLDVVQQNRR
ncbi:hypothetical protein PHYC_00011 [Phycisphaerales bacterium]|nr:hypothetical protein PHYC_00011 [Phycisphaerales bacterium]